MAVSNVELRVDARNAVQQLKRTNDASKKLNATLGNTERKAATATGNIQRMGVSFRTTVGSVVALTGAVTFLSRSLNVLGDRQADAAALANGLQKLGKGSYELERLQKVADELGKATLFDQEDFDRGFALLTSFQSIGVESYTRVAKAAADVAQVTKQDVNSSFLQLAKALQDPVRGLTALSRSGTTFTDEQKEQIKTLVESGKQLQAQQFILAEIEKQYSGAAEAAGSAGYAGAVDSLGESFRDFQETLATAVQPAVVNALNTFTSLFDTLSKIPEPVSQLAIEVGLVTAGIIALTKAVRAFLATKLAAAISTQISLMKAFGAQIYLTAAAQGIATASVKAYALALNALPFAFVAAGFAGFIGQLLETKKVQKEVNDLINEGSVEQLNAALATNKRTLAEIEFQRTVLRATPGALGGFAAGAFDVLDQATGRTKALSDSIEILQGQLAEGMIGGGALPLDQPTPPKPKPTKDKKDLAKAEQQRLSFLKQINAEINRMNQAELDGIEAGRQIVEQIDARGAAEIKRGETNLALLQAKIDGRLEEEQLAQKIKAIEESNLNDVQKEKQIAIVNQTAALEKQIQAAEKLDQVYKSIGSAISDGIVNALTAAVEGTKSLADVASQTLRQVANILLQFGVNTALGGIPGFGKFFGGGKASGGTVTGGRSYMVGEKGPELFTPGRTGSIAPSGSFGETNVVVNVDASGSQAQGNQPNAKALGSAIGAAVQAELIKQKRPGGILA